MSVVQALGEGNQQPDTHQFLRQVAETCEDEHFFTTLFQLTQSAGAVTTL